MVWYSLRHGNFHKFTAYFSKQLNPVFIFCMLFSFLSKFCAVFSSIGYKFKTMYRSSGLTEDKNSLPSSSRDLPVMLTSLLRLYSWYFSSRRLLLSSILLIWQIWVFYSLKKIHWNITFVHKWLEQCQIPPIPPEDECLVKNHTEVESRQLHINITHYHLHIIILT